MKRFLLSALVFILILALTIVSTILAVNLHNSNGRLSQTEQRLSNLEELLAKATSGGDDLELPDFSEYSKLVCNNVSEDGNLILLAPCQNSVVSNEPTVYGIVRGMFENTFNYYVELDNVVVDSGFVTYIPTGDIGTAGLFSIDLDLTELESGDIPTLSLYYDDARDGDQVELVSIDLEIE